MSGPISSAVLVGRDDERARLRTAIGRAASGSPATVVVGGDAGVGKTRLVSELAREAAAGGAIVLTGACPEVGGESLPYAAVVEALRSLPAVLPSGELDGVLGGGRAELARLVPELEPEREPEPEHELDFELGGAAGGGPAASGRLLDLVLATLHRLAAGRPVVLLIEDVHWADPSTLRVLTFLARNLRHGVALLVTYRGDELHRRHPLRPFLAELDRCDGAERLDLRPLVRRELAELLAAILGHAPEPAMLARVWACSEGNPFYAEELVAARADGCEPARDLRELVLARVEALPVAVQGMLRVGAVAGRRVDGELLAAVSGGPEERLATLLRDAAARHVLVTEGPGGGYAFRHALVQEAIYDDLLPGERVPLHAAWARALADQVAARGPRATAAELGRLAAHWYAARDPGAALPAAIRAGEAAVAAGACAEAQCHYERALELWDLAPAAAAGSPIDRVTLLWRAADAASGCNATGRSRALTRLAQAAIHEPGPPSRFQERT